MKNTRKVGHKKAHKGHRGHKGTTVLPAHMLGKSLTKKVGRKRTRKGK
jgi:hypothetical protein